jgi:uncharacterized protein
MKRHWSKFLMFTFLLTYLCHGALAILNHQGVIQLLSFPGQVLFILGGSSPTIMAFVVVHRFYTGDDNKAFYRSLVNFKQPFVYYAIALLTPIVLGMIYLLIAYLLGNPVVDQVSAPLQFFVFFFPAIIFGGLEEVGWRGILQERLSHRFNPLSLAVIIGLIWGAWHVPMLLIPDLGYGSDVFLPFILQGIVFSLFLTYLFAKTTSIPLVVFCHAAINAAGSIGLIIPFENRLDVYLYLLIGLTLGATLLSSHKRTSKA